MSIKCNRCIVHDVDSMSECDQYRCIAHDDVYDTYNGNYSSREVYGCKQGKKVWYLNYGHRVNTYMDEKFEEEYDKDEIEFILSQM